MQREWAHLCDDHTPQPYFRELMSFVKREREVAEVYPPEPEMWTAFTLAPLSQCRVVIVGQDPYHGPGQAHGLAFSVPDGVAPPPSLRNIITEAISDVGIHAPSTGNLTTWAEQGVLLLNTTLTVRQGEPGSHTGRGWEIFTDAVITEVSRSSTPVIFVLWGAHAQKKKRLIVDSRHIVLESVHPSPLSAHRGFFGSRPFSRINESLLSAGLLPINWQLPYNCSAPGE